MQRKLLHVFLIAFCIATFYSLLFLAGFFSSWQDRASDSLFLQRRPHPDVVIIGIDDKSIQAIGRWPWPRSEHARLLESLKTGPIVVGYDVSFPEPSNASDDARLASAIQQTRKTILPLEAGVVSIDGSVTTVRRILGPIPVLADVSSVGIVNTVAGTDSITRYIPVHMERDTQQLDEHFSLLLAREYMLVKQQVDPTKLVKSEGGLMRINFVGRPDSFPIYSFIDVVNGEIPAERFKDKIVLVGATAINLHDNQITSVSGRSPMSGVEIHANAVQTILQGRYLVSEPAWATVAVIWATTFTIAAVMAFIGLLPATIMVVVYSVIYVVYAFFSFDHGTIRNIVFPLFIVVTTYTCLALYRYFVEYNQRKFLRRAFSFYVSGAVLDEITQNPAKLSLGGERREMTVFFADIAGFTSISERLPPDELSAMLNMYLTRVSKIIFKYNGVIDKFIGDAIMAFWNAPFDDKQHALNACRAALEIQEEVERIKDDWEHLNIKNFNVRIGMNTGDMVVGNMGSDMRFDYTVLGDNVNLASRMEGINRIYGTYVLISRSTYEQVEGEVTVRLIDVVAVKGKKKGVTLYELICLGKPNEQQKSLIEKYGDAWKLYEKGDFTSALAAFEAVHEEFPHDEPTKLFIQRCKDYCENPPEEWDGIYHSTSK